VFGEGFDHVLRAARRGDEDAWTRIYLDVVPALTGYLRGRGCPTSEDIAAETLLQIVRDLHRFDGDEAAFRSWVFTVAHHRMIDASRHRAARPSDAVEPEQMERVGHSISFEEDAIAALGSSELEHLLAATTPEQREVLLLRYVADLTLHEAAQVLGKEYNAVKALHRRALSALRAHVMSDAYPQGRGRTLTPSG
jgi:RNA polymerase sigma factor (sigma-70 family)